MSDNDQTIRIEFDGDGVEPESVATMAVLRFAYSYLLFLQKVAENSGKNLDFSGLSVVHKCAALAVNASSLTVADSAIARGNRILQRPASVAPGVMRALHKEREWVVTTKQKLPSHYETAVITRKRRRTLIARSPIPLTQVALWERTTLRVMVARVGGKTQPAALFDSPAEERSFTLRVNRDLAKQLAKHLYEEIELVARLKRDGNGQIIEGEAESFASLDDTDAIEAWDKWYALNDQGWSEVENVEAELGRDGSHPTS